MTPPLFLAPERLLADGGIGGLQQFTLDGPEGRHAATVRRLRVGERVDVADGVGTVARCVVTSVDRDALDVEVLEHHREQPESPRLVVVQALPKGDRGELAVEVLTEAGVDVIVPWSAARSVTQWRGDRGGRALARWRSTAREAAKQARRAWLPEVTDPVDTEGVAARVAAAALGVVLDADAQAPLAATRMPSVGEIVLVVGPEGGIAPEEAAVLARAGAVPRCLGPTVLRTSTAGVAAAAVVLARTPRWGGSGAGAAAGAPDGAG